MKLIKILGAAAITMALTVGPVMAADKTCCEKAAAQGKECSHKCCVSAHRDGKSCEKCNPSKQDVKLIKKDKKSNKATAKKDTTAE